MRTLLYTYSYKVLYTIDNIISFWLPHSWWHLLWTEFWWCHSRVGCGGLSRLPDNRCLCQV